MFSLFLLVWRSRCQHFKLWMGQTSQWVECMLCIDVSHMNNTVIERKSMYIESFFVPTVVNFPLSHLRIQTYKLFYDFPLKRERKKKLILSFGSKDVKNRIQTMTHSYHNGSFLNTTYACFENSFNAKIRAWKWKITNIA